MLRYYVTQCIIVLMLSIFFFMLGKEGVTDTIRLTIKQLQDKTAFVLFAVLLY